VTERQQSQLVGWLKANVLAAVMAIVTLTGSGFWAIYAMGRYFQNSETQIEKNEGELRDLKAAVKTLQTDLVSVDARLNEAKTAATDYRLNMERERARAQAANDASDATMRARLDVIEALSKFNTERVTQPNLPTPYAGRR
jgi:hypothetical protein